MINIDVVNPFRQYFDDDNRFECLCRKFIIASILYYRYDVSCQDDARYDNSCRTLFLSYDKLPQWFTERVDRAALCAGTGYFIEPTSEEVKISEEFISGVFDMNTCF